jgi:cardiolipin synthase
VGSRGFLRSQQASDLVAAGVQIHAALPVGLLRAFLYRFDLRLHRKIVVIDHTIGYVGSQNMADPKLFRRGAGFGQWIDAMVRITGPSVDSLAMVFFEDWQFETAPVAPSREPPSIPPVPSATGRATVQVVPSGPGLNSEAIMQILLNAIYMADRELILTTPYFVPDESLQRALISAARRGVNVTIVIPAKVDSRLVRLASRPYLRELVATGVHVARYQDGMLHTKSISIDFDTSFFGSLNLDPRSLHLNFEIILAVFDDSFTRDLRGLQQQYISHSVLLTTADLAANSFFVRFAENCVRLISPLL